MAAELKTMELKKRDQITSEISTPTREASVAEHSIKKSKFWDFISDVKQELTKISWTTPEELKTYTKIVIIATFCFGMGVYFTDVMIQTILGVLESTIRLIGG